MTDRVVLITGAGSGIGAVIAEQAAVQGDRVVIADIDAAAAGRVAGRLPGSMPLTLDVTSRSQVFEAIGVVRREFGEVEVLVNNAAIASDVPFGVLTEELWRQDISVSLDGAFHTISAVLPGMIEAGGGAIVNVRRSTG